MAKKTSDRVSCRRSQRARAGTTTVDEFLTSLISDARLPNTEVVRAQLAWILELASDPFRGIWAAPVVAGGYRTLQQKISALRKALQKAEQIRATLASWSEDSGKEAEFYRNAIADALYESSLVPTEMVSRDGYAVFIRRVEQLLVPLRQEVIGELRRIESFASKPHPRIRYDLKERCIVQLLWLVFEVSGCRVTMSSRGSEFPSPFQRTCIAICQRANYMFRPGCGSQGNNFQNRIRDAVADGKRNRRLFRIKAIAERRQRSRAAVHTEMMFWQDWVSGLPIEE